MADEEKKDMAWKVLLWAIAGFISINTAFLTYFGGIISDVNSRVIVIEASRFSYRDGAELSNSVSRLEQTVAGFQKQLPPQWLIDQIKDVEVRVILLERGLGQGSDAKRGEGTQ